MNNLLENIFYTTDGNRGVKPSVFGVVFLIALVMAAIMVMNLLDGLPVGASSSCRQQILAAAAIEQRLNAPSLKLQLEAPTQVTIISDPNGGFASVNVTQRPLCGACKPAFPPKSHPPTK